MKNKQQRPRTTKLDEVRATTDRYAARLRRVEHEAGELRTRLDTLARQAAFNTPPSIRDHKDLWVVAVEAMAERARFVVDVAAGIRA